MRVSYYYLTYIRFYNIFSGGVELEYFQKQSDYVYLIALKMKI